MKRPILEYPNPFLREVSRVLTPEDIRSPEIQHLINEMKETLYNHTGAVGLAAIQVGEAVRILLMDASAKTTRDQLFVMINPVILDSAQWKFCREGCLSFPDYLVNVKRAKKLTLSWLDETGESHTQLFKEFEAVIIQHELDHLEGILFIDRVKNFSTDVVMRDAENTAKERLELST
jgi:peptide deformylase